MNSSMGTSCGSCLKNPSSPTSAVGIASLGDALRAKRRASQGKLTLVSGNDDARDVHRLAAAPWERKAPTALRVCASMPANKEFLGKSRRMNKAPKMISTYSFKRYKDIVPSFLVQMPPFCKVIGR
jgi:hypothetical protein